MYHVVLFVHLFAIVLAFFAVGLLHSGTQHLHRSRSVEEARAACAQVAGASKLPPLALLLLLLTGAYMTQSTWTWSTPWIYLGVAAAVIIGIVGGGVMGGRERGLLRLLQAAPGGAISEEIQRRIHDPLTAVGSAAIPFFVFAVMLMMVVKPGLGGGLLMLAAGAALGIGIGFLTLPSHRHVEAAAEAQSSSA